MAEQVYLGRYKVARHLDDGGLSRIYLARQTGLNREVVVKVLKPEFLGQSKVREHFRREIHVMSRFQHPNAVQYLDAVPHDPAGPVLVMEYLRGLDLGMVLHRQGRFTPERAGHLLGQLCDVLQACHDAGVIHRDLKPGNLMVLDAGTPDERLKLMDFGLAKMVSMLYIAPDELQNYPEPAASGTPEYISPEEVRGMTVDPRTDLYSVGVVLYEMLSGRLPFAGDDPVKLMRGHAHLTPPTFAELGLGTTIPPAVEAVVRSCLGKQPDDRPRNPTELALRYEQALGKKITQFRRAAPPSAAQGTGLGKRPSSPATPPGAAASRTGASRNGLHHSLEAVMPEALAMVKLKGFIHDLGGAVVESVPGMIRVRLGDPAAKKKSGLMTWLGGGTATEAVPATLIELHMERLDPLQPNRLTITLVVNPPRGLVTTEWRDRCNKIGRDLQAYLMGR